MNSDKGGEEGPFWNPSHSLQVPSNVTRISRSFKHRCSDGRMQIINYESGIGTGSNMLDTLAGGAFGTGLSEVGSCPACHTSLAYSCSAFERLISSSVRITATATKLSLLASPVALTRCGPSLA